MKPIRILNWKKSITDCVIYFTIGGCRMTWWWGPCCCAEEWLVLRDATGKDFRMIYICMASLNSTPKPYWSVQTTLPFSLTVLLFSIEGTASVTTLPSGKNKSVSINAPLLPKFLIKHSWIPYLVAKNEDSEQNFRVYFLLFFIIVYWGSDKSLLINWLDRLAFFIERHFIIGPGLQHFIEISWIQRVIPDEILQTRMLTGA